MKEMNELVSLVVRVEQQSKQVKSKTARLIGPVGSEEQVHFLKQRCRSGLAKQPSIHESFVFVADRACGSVHSYKLQNMGIRWWSIRIAFCIHLR